METKRLPMGLTAEQIAAYHEVWRQRALRVDPEAEKRRARALELVPRAAELLRREFGATRVVLFGSLAHGDFTRWSDIDLVAWGIPSAEWLRAMSRAESVDDEIHVDLVLAQMAKDAVLEEALKDGVAVGA